MPPGGSDPDGAAAVGVCAPASVVAGGVCTGLSAPPQACAEMAIAALSARVVNNAFRKADSSDSCRSQSIIRSGVTVCQPDKPSRPNYRRAPLPAFAASAGVPGESSVKFGRPCVVADHCFPFLWPSAAASCSFPLAVTLQWMQDRRPLPPAGRSPQHRRGWG